MAVHYPITSQAIRIVQPLGEFFVTSIPAKVLLETTFSDPLRVDLDAEVSTYGFRGSQREESESRLHSIGRFIETAEAAFPNSIILAANYSSSGELLEDDAMRWKIKRSGESGVFELTIPTARPVASIIDGQHRLHGFRYAAAERSDMDLLCVVYLDLPSPYQAFLFATINFHQKRVDRSLAYELFGFAVEDECPESWSPEKAAVFFARKLNTQQGGPFQGHIRVSAQDDDELYPTTEDDTWQVSTGTVVDGILRLFSANPGRDRDLMHQQPRGKDRRRSLLSGDNTPLRALYLAGNDLAIYTAIDNFFQVVRSVLWSAGPRESYLRKNVGVQALFDMLRELLMDFSQSKDISKGYFSGFLEKAKDVDFTDNFFQASGKGRVRIKNVIRLLAGRVDVDDLPEPDREEYRRFLST